MIKFYVHPSPSTPFHTHTHLLLSVRRRKRSGRRYKTYLHFVTRVIPDCWGFSPTLFVLETSFSYTCFSHLLFSAFVCVCVCVAIKQVAFSFAVLLLLLLLIFCAPPLSPAIVFLLCFLSFFGLHMCVCLPWHTSLKICLIFCCCFCAVSWSL